MKLSKKIRIVSLIVSAFLIYVIYGERTELKVYGNWIIVMQLIIVALAFIWIIIRAYLSKSVKRKKVLKRALARSYIVVMSFAIVLFIEELLAPQIYIYKEKHKLLTPTVVSGNLVKVRQGENDLLENKEMLSRLDSETYKTLSEQEHMDALYQMAYVEAEHLGLSSVPTLQATYLSDLNLGGFYQDDSNSITLNSEYIDREYLIVEILLHEMYHAYQKECISKIDIDSNLLFAREVADWRQEFAESHPVPETDEESEEYLGEKSEISAREYAKERIELYKEVFGIAALGRLS